MDATKALKRQTRIWKVVLIMLLAVPAVIERLSAQNFSNGFNFSLPSSDSTTQRFLPAFPKLAIGDSDFVRINADGKFSANGSRIRFWGTNAAADAAFPSPAITDLLAGRLRKFGLNLVRMHHLDNPWSSKSLLGTTSTRTLNAANLDLLERYITALKENGIYVNMNLHVSRTFRINDNVANYDSLPEFGKCINFFDPYVLQLHKEYAQQLLTHMNPYTGKALVNDPVMAMVEITNENSLYRNWRDNRLKAIGSGGFLPSRYARMLDSVWMDFLRNKYPSTNALRNAWDVGIIPSGQNEQIVNGGFEAGTSPWLLELHAPASGTFTRDNTNPYGGAFSGKVTVTSSTGIDWNIQFKQATATIRRDSSYTITFAARSDSWREISVSLMNDNSPWTTYGGRSIVVSPFWQVYSFSLTVPEDNVGHTRLSFAVGKVRGTYWFDNVSMTKAAVYGLLPQESFESNNIARIDYTDCVSYSLPRVKDLSAFYIALQRKYFLEMKLFLKNTLGVRVPIVGTNWNVGPADLAAMSDEDYVDNHGYWDHPSFPNGAWSETDWLIQNKPMLKHEGGGVLPPLLSGVPMVGKPFTVSEYNHPNPNQYQVESVLLSTGYSAFHDADAFMYYAYDEPDDWENDRIGGFFGINRNSVYMSFFPTTSLVFRRGLLKPSSNPITIQYSADTLYSLPRNDGVGWFGPSLYDRKISLTHAIRTNSYFANSTTNFSSLPPAGMSPYKTDTEEISWNTTDGTMSIEADKFNGAAGYLSRLRNRRIGSMTLVDFPSSDFGAATWVSLTDSSLPRSERSLITLGSKTQNTGMIWNSDSTSVGNNWGTAPTLIYPLRLDLDLNIYADSIRVYPLNTIAREGIISPFMVLPASSNHFIVRLDQTRHRTLWFGIEKYGNGVETDVRDDADVPQEFSLQQNYPNPFNPTTNFGFQIAELGLVTLRIYDMLGQEVATVVNKQLKPGKYEVTFSANSGSGAGAYNLASGVYFYRLQSGGRGTVKRMLLLR